MKPSDELIQSTRIEAIFLAVILFFAAILESIGSFAQSVPDKVDVNVNTNNTAWYGQPWIWAIGVAMFIIVVVAISRTGSKNA